MRTAKYRRAFNYSNEDDSRDSPPEILDDEEQENLIRELDKINAEGNQFYTRTLTCFPLISILPYLRTLFIPSIGLFSFVSITSLFSTAYLLIHLPPGKTGIIFLDRLNRFSSSSSTKPILRQNALTLSSSQGPIMKYLPYLNLCLCAILTISGIFGATSKRKEELGLGLLWLPLINYGAVLLAAYIMGGINPHRELSDLRYSHKGA